MKIQVVDSHTGGEPTRLVLSGWEPPESISHDVVEIRKWIDRTQGEVRNGLLREPRGSSAWVGGLLVPARSAEALCGIVFFNTHATLGMCGHGMIGLIETLRFLGKFSVGVGTVETPVGDVQVTGHEDGSVELRNVPSFVFREDVLIDLPGYGEIVGDIAWGGNWFFLVSSGGPEVSLSKLAELNAFTIAVKKHLFESKIFGRDGGEIDHVEVFGTPTHAGSDSKNYVLCPSHDYDRSPCGTGTSAKLATLYHKGKLKIGQKWVQESITGSAFTGWLEQDGDDLIPHIRGTASIMGEGTLLFSENDLFRWGISETV